MSPDQGGNSRPNIVCILVDDLGYGDLSCQGAEDLLTPNIDKIMNEGLRFTQFYANCPVCSPSRAALLTGRYPDMVGVPGVIRQWTRDSFGYLSHDAVLLPEVLQKAGYQTAIVGKWHLGYDSPNIPNDRGFDLFQGFLGDMMDDYWTHMRGGVNWMRQNKQEINPEGHATDLFTKYAVEYITNKSDEEPPFFLYLAYNAPHDPIQPPEEWFEKVRSREIEISEERAKLVAFIEHMDNGIGEVIRALDENNQLETTVIVFTSDNGGSLIRGANNGYLRGGKGDMYEGGIRVPAGIYWKGKIDKRRVTHNPGMLSDLFPTICDLAEAEYNHEIDGISLLPTIMGDEQATDQRYLFWVRREGGKYGGQAYYAARHGDYKILHNGPFQPIEFYNMCLDYQEKKQITDQDNPNFKVLFEELQEHIRKSGAVPWQKSE